MYTDPRIDPGTYIDNYLQTVFDNINNLQQQINDLRLLIQKNHAENESLKKNVIDDVRS